MPTSGLANVTGAHAADRDVTPDPSTAGARPGAPDSYRKVERDLEDLHSPSTLQRMVARVELARSGPRVQEAIAHLSGSDQARYKALDSLLENDATARLALASLALRGRLTGDPKARDGSSVLSNLSRLATQPLAEGLDRAELVSGLVRELETPTAISQGMRGTCTVTVLQTKLAAGTPAEYTRLVAGLAGPEGRVTMANGEALARAAGTSATDDSHRTPSSRLFQSAVMEYGNGRFTYDNRLDSNSGAGSGLAPAEVARSEGALTGQAFEVRMLGVLPRIQEETAAGHSVAVGLNWGSADAFGRTDERHEVLVTRIAQDRVYYANPWGTEESMTLADFGRRLTYASLPKQASRAADPHGDPESLARRTEVTQRLDGLITEYGRSLQALDAQPANAATRERTTRMESLLPMLQDLRDQVQALPLPRANDAAEAKRYGEALDQLWSAASRLTPH